MKEKILELLTKKPDTVIIVDLTSGLRLGNILLKGGIKTAGFEAAKLDTKKDSAILDSIREFIHKNNLIPKNAILLPSLNSLYLKRIRIPFVPDNEIPQAVKWKIKEDAPFDLSKAVLGYQVLKKITKDDGAIFLDIMAACGQEEGIKKQVNLIRQSGLICLAVALPVFGFAKFIEAYFKQGPDEACTVLYLDEDNCYIAFYKENRLHFYRQLPVTVDKLKESLGTALLSGAGRIELTPNEREEVLLKFGMPLDNFVYKDKISSNQILSMLRPDMERLSQEIKRSLAFYGSEFHEQEPSKIYIAGCGQSIPNIDTYLVRELSLDVLKLSLPGIPPEAYAGLGCAIDFPQGINLLPDEFRMEKVEKAKNLLLRWIALSAFLVLIIPYLFARGIIGINQKRLDNITTQLNVLLEVKRVKENIDAFDNFAAEIKKVGEDYGYMLKKLSNIAPSGLLISNLSLRPDIKSGSMEGIVKGPPYNASAEALLSKFAKDLSDSGLFIDAAISAMEKSAQETTGIVNFKITFKLR